MAMTEAPFSLTVKTPRGNLFTIRGETAADLKANLNAAPEEGVLGLIAQIEATLAGQPKAQPVSGGSTGLAGSSTIITPVSTAAAGCGPGGGASTSGQELPSGFGAPPCAECGGETRFAQEGVSKKSGQPYKRYACVTNQLHKSTFAK